MKELGLADQFRSRLRLELCDTGAVTGLSLGLSCFHCDIIEVIILKCFFFCLKKCLGKSERYGNYNVSLSLSLSLSISLSLSLP